ncbi:hypothetical protein AB4Z50_14880 [Paenibacillus sp. 2TAB26]
MRSPSNPRAEAGLNPSDGIEGAYSGHTYASELFSYQITHEWSEIIAIANDIAAVGEDDLVSIFFLEYAKWLIGDYSTNTADE